MSLWLCASGNWDLVLSTKLACLVLLVCRFFLFSCVPIAVCFCTLSYFSLVLGWCVFTVPALLLDYVAYSVFHSTSGVSLDPIVGHGLCLLYGVAATSVLRP